MSFDPLSDLLRFLQGSPSPWHAAQEIGNRLAEQDFTPLDEEEKWELEGGVPYFVQRGGSICAFIAPKEAPKRGTILASHTDSPSLKLKPHPIFIEENLAFLKVEPYGSPILRTWLNRDLAIAGRLFIDGKEGVEEEFVFLEEMPVMIPSLAIHLDREVNDKPSAIDKERHLCPLLGIDTKGKTADHLLEKLFGRAASSILGADLYLTPLDPPRLLGLDGALIGSYRVDNLVSAHAALLALLATEKRPKDHLQMAVFYNHEEIGSGSDEGASSPFFHDLLKRIALNCKMNEEDFLRMKMRSQIISIDMTHAYHPGYKKHYDKENSPETGKGVVIKYSANQRYATNGLTGATIAKLCEEKKIPVQSFSPESNIPCGSTIGPISAVATGIETVDIGLAQFSMHAARELVAAKDHLDLCKLLKALLES